MSMAALESGEKQQHARRTDRRRLFSLGVLREIAAGGHFRDDVAVVDLRKHKRRECGTQL